MGEWSKVLVGLVASTVAGFLGGYLMVKLIVKLFRHTDRRKANKFFHNGQAFGAGAMAFYTERKMVRSLWEFYVRSLL